MTMRRASDVIERIQRRLHQVRENDEGFSLWPLIPQWLLILGGIAFASVVVLYGRELFEGNL